jgi:hypothetical protein
MFCWCNHILLFPLCSILVCLPSCSSV